MILGTGLAPGLTPTACLTTPPSPLHPFLAVGGYPRCRGGHRGFGHLSTSSALSTAYAGLDGANAAERWAEVVMIRVVKVRGWVGVGLGVGELVVV